MNTLDSLTVNHKKQTIAAAMFSVGGNFQAIYTLLGVISHQVFCL